MILTYRCMKRKRKIKIKLKINSLFELDRETVLWYICINDNECLGECINE